jgi:hypothetical protein
MKNNTLKEYYIKIEELFNNAVNMLTAINQSLYTSGSEVSVSIKDSYGEESSIRIPSFLYLENKLEMLSNNFNNLFDMPRSGEAWFSASDTTNMYKLKMVTSGYAPLTPEINTSDAVAFISDNNALRDLVSPRTNLKLNISNLPNNINNIYVKKIIIHTPEIFNSLKNANIYSYADFQTYAYGLKKGIDYEEYDSILQTPLKRDKFSSRFEIVDIPDKENNPWLEDIAGTSKKKYCYRLQLNTLKYTDIEDSSIEFSIKVGDKLCLNNEMVIFKVKSVNKSSNIVEIEEEVGHIFLQKTSENSLMSLSIYNNDFSEYQFVNVPLEENPYLCLFIGTVSDNVRSLLSEGIFVNLNEIYILDRGGNYIIDANGNKMSYIQYYEKYCTNIGDIITSLSQISYPHLSLLNNSQLEELQTSTSIKDLVTQSITGGEILKVIPINKHIVENSTTEEIINLHAQKNALNSKLNAVNTSISDTNSKLVNTDFQQDVSVTQTALQAQLTSQYSDRLLVQKQLISVVENINTNISKIEGKDLKYRIRGISEVENLEKYLKGDIHKKLDIVGMDVEYKYKSINKEVTTTTSINSNVFSDWNKLVTIDKQRILEFDSTTNSYEIKFENYNATNNIIKWNQLDIPIVADEDVVVRVRYKLNIGQPFINIYTPWSAEHTVVFPTEYKDNVEVTTIINDNQNDIINAKFNATLINDGYYDHITNGLNVNDSKFYHMPENIYSGFNTPENKMISLKDKLSEISSNVETYKKWLDSETQQKYEVSLKYDSENVKLIPSGTNQISIMNNDHISNAFVKKEMEIVITNTGEVPVKFYSIFPGNINTPLLLCSDDFYEKTIINYERVPIISDDIITGQKLGQWIYFRQNNPWTFENLYYETEYQNEHDTEKILDGGMYNKKLNLNWQNKLSFMDNNKQVLLGYRKRDSVGDTILGNQWKGLNWENGKFTLFEDYLSTETNIHLKIEKIRQIYGSLGMEQMIYPNTSNNYLTRYEDIYYIDAEGNYVYLDNETSISEFIGQRQIPGGFRDDTDFLGAFLYPNLKGISSVLTDGSIGSYVELGVGKSMSVPVVLEFYLNQTLKSVKKSICFDLKASSYRPIEHFLVEINALHDYTSTAETLSDISLSDDITLDL